MTISTPTPQTKYEKKLLAIMRQLPPKRVEQLVDFADFLQSRTKTDDQWLEENDAERSAAANEQWDALFASEEGQNLLDSLVEQAKVDIKAGRVYGIKIIEEGELSPDELSNNGYVILVRNSDDIVVEKK